ncbi:MAG TPA: phosphoribosylformylglycinamidine cyclo-ligase [Bdellovibrionales bacterium]|nr:MAG: phosphoribosylformylglycinamidine cyclo-ligase [Bdellovibrionales bacterium GWB1_52_6]OFZ04143.1 MAG: phosphoribosylformylglycinamidine cyclo-ligase [Bdellovibrionales bacterium GWA1_52_35]HAR41572.1 phosphoribosylformylglycinamidine cyclo-ligase [Bdellovibrionales bacterium]HCM40483.1 phosphoribosylformylglycinamidine cyclo-ligase [Bdellovibrionales bacterium]
MAALDYAKSGVNRESADVFVEKIALLSIKTLNKRVKASIGGYASLFELDKKRWLAASTDGVGTKLKLAFRLGEHSSVGIDLVAMSVNDLLCVGAEPLFFLDYFATGKLDPGIAEEVLKGIVDGCQQAGCALVGGETAEMPDFYAAGEYDLGGFAVGIVDPSRVLPRAKNEIRPGDICLGIGSSGCHSNGFSLLRKLLPSGRSGDQLAWELLTPTRIYVKALKPLLAARKIKGLAHITGSGFLNVPRISEKVSYDLTLPAVEERPRIFKWIEEQSGLEFPELARTFNLGIGMVAVVEPKAAMAVLKALEKSGEKAWVLGQVIKKKSAASASQVNLRSGGEMAVLE